MNHTDVMIDIETLSTEYNACIIAIGAVKFNLYDPSKKREELELLIDVKSCEELNCHKCENTIDWWNKQPEDVLKHVFDDEPRFHVKDAIIQLNNFCKGCSKYWSQGSFDYIILENTMKLLKIEPVWKFWQIRDSRTIGDICKDIPKKPEKAHSPVVDCNHQINVVHFVYNKINAKETILGKRQLKFNLNGGDWECKQCNNINFKYRNTCFSCNKIK
jgi:hypothetical protein